jgi:hypothetical protein
MSDQPKHTPGPWFAKRAGDGRYFEWYVGRDGGNCSIAEDITDPVTRDPSEANAHLIAAAPDLLEALKMMMEGGLEGPTSQATETALAAIAKAEGRGA